MAHVSQGLLQGLQRRLNCREVNHTHIASCDKCDFGHLGVGEVQAGVADAAEGPRNDGHHHQRVREGVRVLPVMRTTRCGAALSQQRRKLLGGSAERFEALHTSRRLVAMRPQRPELGSTSCQASAASNVRMGNPRHCHTCGLREAHREAEPVLREVPHQRRATRRQGALK